jgi:hypothetical protein
MTQPAAKLSISLPSDLADAVRERVGPRGLSGFIARAIAHELEREQLSEFLEELEEQHGPVSKAAVEQARKEWPKR